MRKRGRACIIAKVVEAHPLGELVLAMPYRNRQVVECVSLPPTVLAYARQRGIRWWVVRLDASGESYGLRLDDVERLGWLRASEQKDLSSEKAWKGTARKFGMVGLLVILGQQMDTFLETGFWRHAIVLFFCASEGLSILENAVAVGLPVPDWLRGILVQLKERKYVRPGEGPSETPPPAPWSG